MRRWRFHISVVKRVYPDDKDLPDEMREALSELEELSDDGRCYQELHSLRLNFTDSVLFVLLLLLGLESVIGSWWYYINAFIGG